MLLGGRAVLQGVPMRGFSFRFEIVRITIGVAVITVAGVLFEFLPVTRIIAIVMACCGLLLTADGLVKFSRSKVIVHHQWSEEKVLRELARAPESAVIQILQTWIPEEDFITSLEHLYLQGGKRFHLQVMLVNPQDSGAIDVLAARMKLRGDKNRAQAAEEVTAALDDICRLKRDVDSELRRSWKNGGRPDTVDLEVRLYDFLPFGPVYKIGDEVMFIGFYLNHVSSVRGPMIEIRKNRCPGLWHEFEKHLNKGWSDSTLYFPARTSRTTKTASTPRTPRTQGETV
jgi:hypothetical protein